MRSSEGRRCPSAGDDGVARALREPGHSTGSSVRAAGGVEATEPWRPTTEWTVGEDGVPFRRAARVLLLDPDGRVLLVRGHDADNPDRTWWFTVGGGIEDGESPRAAAVRELREETGIVLAPHALTGPVLERTAVMDFASGTVHQHERFYLAHLPRVVEVEALSTRGWTEIERSFMDELGWFTPQDLERVGIEVFPAGLADLLREVRHGWDGLTRTV